MYHSLKSGKLRWKKLRIPTESQIMQSRLRHGALNYKDQEIYIFGGASSNSFTSGHYNDVWKYSQENNFQRISTSSATFPSPKCNFSMTESNGDKFFVVGGRSSINSVGSEQPYSNAMQAVFEIHTLNTINGHWHKLQTSGSEPQFPSGCRSIMLSPLELLVVSGLVPTFQNFEAMAAEENFQYRTSMQIHILKFTDLSLERGHWHQLADVQSRRNSQIPPPRIETHLVHLQHDRIFMYGGRAISSNLQDAWIMKINKTPSYSLKFIPVIIDNLMVPSLPSHSFPSCVINDLLVFTAVRTSLLKKPEVERTRSNNNGNNAEPRKNLQSPQVQSTSSQPVKVQQLQEMRRIFINQERPINTIGAMAAFSVSSSSSSSVNSIPQKVIKIQASPEPIPSSPKRLLQDYPMRIFCLDLSNIMINCSEEMVNSGKLTVRWLPMKRDGLYPCE